ncbi:unannotated protein [freshwater metagenome]|uniref:Unannotated protein n=1 Tax=freshwater metagenome TaxID=449393 RepID=A0A6J6JYB4_9ZZZZ
MIQNIGAGDATECFKASHALRDGMGNKVVPVFAGFGVDFYFLTGCLLDCDPASLDVENVPWIGPIANNQVGARPQHHPVIARGPNP